MPIYRFYSAHRVALETVLNELKNSGVPICAAWDRDALSNLKLEIKKYNMSRRDNKCCYCLRDFSSNHLSIVDGEHVLPKSKFPRLVFSLKNLSVSCKRCNSSIKGSRVDFLNVSIEYAQKKPFISENYKFLHPNLDSGRGRLELEIRTRTYGNVFIKYYYDVNDLKAIYTYSYFELSKLEVEAFNINQGKKEKVTTSSSADKATLEEIEVLKKKL